MVEFVTLSVALAVIDYIIVLTILAGLLAATLSRSGAEQDVRFIVGIGFILRAVYATVDNHLGLLAGRYDFFRYNSVLSEVARQWQQGDLLAVFAVPQPFDVPYSLAYAPLYTIFGHEEVLIRLLTAMFGSLFVWNIYRLTTVLDTHRAGLIASGAAAIFPYWIYLSGLFYRDMLIAFLLSEMLYLLVVSLRTAGIRPWLGAGAVGIACLSLRPQNIAIIVATFGVAGAVQLHTEADRNRLTFFVGLLGASSLAVIWSLQYTKLVRMAAKNPIKTLRRQRNFLARESATASYLSDLLYSNVVELVLFLPVGSVYFWLVPFPWQISTVKGAVALVQNLVFWYPIILFGFLGLWKLALDRPGETLVLATFLGAGTVMYGAVEGNVGPAMRHRSQFQFLVFAVAGIGAARFLRVEIGDRFRAVREATNAVPTVFRDDD